MESLNKSMEIGTQLREMADSMPQLVWITRPDGYHEFYNKRWYNFTGTKPGSVDGEAWNKVFHPDDQKKAMRLWKRCLKSGKAYEVEYRLYYAKTNSYRWVIGRAKPYKEDGEIVRWYGTCTDIDEQKRAVKAQEILTEASRQLSSSLDYRTTLQSISEVCVPELADWCSVELYNDDNELEQVSLAHVDPKMITSARAYREHNPVDVNQSTGVGGAIKYGKPQFYPEINEDMIRAAIDDPESLEYMLSLQLRSMVIVPIFNDKDPVGAISLVSAGLGRQFTESDFSVAQQLAEIVSMTIRNAKLYEASISEIDARKKLERQLLLEQQKLESRVKERTEQLQSTNIGLRDEIERRKEVEGQLHENTENLERSNRELEDFAYVASHDLQEPLRKIQAFGDLLESEYADQIGDGKAYLDRMRYSASRMSTLIQDLLMFSRVTTQARDPVKVDLNQVADEVSQDLEARLTDTNGKLTITNLPTVVADPTHMRQLFQNLISNGLKFHKQDESAHVEVRSKKTDTSTVTIEFIDNGIGFDEKYTDKIFSIFQRLHGRDTYEGTGIGLAVCKKIVERYGGTITARSKVGEGATFVVCFPES